MMSLREQNIPSDAVNNKQMSLLGKKFNKEISHEEFEDHDSDETPEDRFSDGKNMKSAHFNKELYMKNYSFKFELPTSFVLNAHIFGRDTRYYYQLVKYVIPSEKIRGTKIRPRVP